MEYSKIISVTGLPGLYELITSKNDGAIVRSLEDKTTRFVSSRAHNFSHLESIEVFTTGENVSLAEIFIAMDKTAETLADEKDNASLKKYFEKVYSEIDFERVYTSDLKKMVKWFSVLKKNDIEIRLPEVADEPTEEIASEVTEAPKTDTNAKVPVKEVPVKEAKAVAVNATTPKAPEEIPAKEPVKEALATPAQKATAKLPEEEKPVADTIKETSAKPAKEAADKPDMKDIPAQPAQRKTPKKKKED